jgi:bifunctional DNA-binding transcriptional regulator/antitoxin component of YhaV-PrlF toxin-antitoxin module
METTRLSAKGQIILPKAVRNAHHSRITGDQERILPLRIFAVEDTGDGVLLRPLKPHATRLDDVVRCLRRKGPARSIEAMNAAIEDELRARRDRG